MRDVRFTISDFVFVYDAQKERSISKSTASALKRPHTYSWIICDLTFQMTGTAPSMKNAG